MIDAIVPYLVVDSLAKIDNIFELRLFGWVLAKAQSVVKYYDKNLADINIEHAMRLTRVTIPARYLLQPGDNNYRNIRRAFNLQTKVIRYERENFEKYLNIIAMPEFFKLGKKSFITFVIHNELWRAMLDFTKGYRLVDVPAVMRLQSCYSVIMYFLVSNQTKPMRMTTAYLKQLLGCDNKPAYDRGSNFIAKVLKPAAKELEEKCPYTFTFAAERTGRGGAYNFFTITPKRAQNGPWEVNGRDEALERQRVAIEDDVLEYICGSFQMKPREVEIMEGMILAIGDTAAQLAFIGNVKETCTRNRVANPAGYLYTALQNRA